MTIPVRKFDALVVGLGVVDEPNIHRAEALPIGAPVSLELANAPGFRVRHRDFRLLMGAFAISCAGTYKPCSDGGDVSWHVLDLVALQGLLAHHRGEWFERFRMEMRKTRGRDRLAVTLFDSGPRLMYHAYLSRPAVRPIG